MWCCARRDPHRARRRDDVADCVSRVHFLGYSDCTRRSGGRDLYEAAGAVGQLGPRVAVGLKVRIGMQRPRPYPYRPLWAGRERVHIAQGGGAGMGGAWHG